MKAIIAQRPGLLQVADCPPAAAPAAGEVKLRVHAGGICGSDVHVLRGESAFATYPRILGHEIAGEVLEVGEGVRNLAVGDHVVVDPVRACGRCYACRVGRYNVCREIRVLAAHVDGGFREEFTLPAGQVHRIAKEIPWAFAATAEPYTIAAEATERARLSGQDSVLICGAGPIGIVILQVAKRLGARVLMLDALPARLERAKALGADDVALGGKEDVGAKVAAFTQGEGVNVIFEATGSIPVLEDCIQKWVSPAGRVVVLGFPTQAARIAPIDIMKRELEILGSRLSCNQFPKVVRWLEEGWIDPRGLLTHSFPFREAPAAFEHIQQHPEDTLKVVLRFD